MWALIGRAVCWLIGHPEPVPVWCPVDNRIHAYCLRCGDHSECSVE